MALDKLEYELVVSPEMERRIEEARVEQAMARLDRQGFISHRAFPKTAAGRAQAKPKGCDECYGTGRFKGIGGPCSEGCPTKGEK